MDPEPLSHWLPSRAGGEWLGSNIGPELIVHVVPNRGLAAGVFGLLAGLVAWLVIGFVFRWTADASKVNCGIYRELHTSFLLLDCRLAARENAGISPEQQSYLQAVAMLRPAREHPILDAAPFDSMPNDCRLWPRRAAVR